jgi:alginate O-acetyltransferase complex protein AlgJ
MNGKKFGIGLTLALSLGLAVAQSGQATRDTLAAKVKEAGESPVVAGTDGWMFFVPELRYLTAGPFWGEDAAKVSKASAGAQDPLPAILDFKAQLDKKGISLLVVPVPAKAAIYADKLVGGPAPAAASRVDAAQAEFLKVLEKNGVKTLDLTPIYLDYRKSYPEQLLYCKTDTHWSGNGIAVAAKAIAARVKQQPWFADQPKLKLVPRLDTIKVSGDLAKLANAASPATETLKLTKVPVTANRQSPLLLLGDSHNLVYSVGGDMLAASSGFPENLALQLGLAPDVVGVMGSGATPARVNLLRRGDQLDGKKMVVWVFTAREFTEGQGWRKVPVIK